MRLTGSTLSILAGGSAGCGDTGSDAGVGFASDPALAVDADGNVYAADIYLGEDQPCNRIRKIAPDGTTTTLSGQGTRAFQDGPPGEAAFNAPQGMAVDSSGFVYVGDTGNYRIRKIAPDGTTTTLAGNGIGAFADGTGGPNGTASFDYPRGVAVDALGNVYVADENNVAIRKIAPDGTTTTLAGNGIGGHVDGTLGINGTARFEGPTAVAIGDGGEIYVADGCSIRVIHLE